MPRWRVAVERPVTEYVYFDAEDFDAAKEFCDTMETDDIPYISENWEETGEHQIGDPEEVSE